MKLGIANFSILMLILTLAACASTPTSVPDLSTPTPVPVATLTSTTEIPPTPSPTATPTSIPEILPTPLSTIPFDDRVLATLEINYADEILFAEGFIWVKTSNGHIVQVDPATNAVTGDVKVDTTSDPYHYCHGLGTDGESIWACSAAGDEDNRTIDVVRVDPQSLEVIATVEVGKVTDQQDMPFLLNQIWVLAENGYKLVGIDVTSNQPRSTIDLGTRCFQLAVMDEELLAACKLDNLVLRIDAEAGEVTARVSIESPRNIAVNDTGVWIAQDSTVTRLDPGSLNPVVTFTGLYEVGTMGDLFATDEAVWVRQESGFLYRIDPARNEVVEQITNDQSRYGGSVLATSDSVWATTFYDYLLIRLSLD